MHHSEDIERTMAEITKLEEAKQLALALERLQKNKDFKLVIQSGYLNKMQDNLVTGLAIVSNEANVQQTVRQLTGIGSLKNFFDVIYNNGLVADRELPELYNTLNQLRLGDADE